MRSTRLSDAGVGARLCPMSTTRSFPARYAGRCERCRGRVSRGQSIRVCPGGYGAYEHVVAADCRVAFRAYQREQFGSDVREGLLTVEAAARILARDDAAAKYPEDPRGQFRR